MAEVVVPEIESGRERGTTVIGEGVACNQVFRPCDRESKVLYPRQFFFVHKERQIDSIVPS